MGLEEIIINNWLKNHTNEEKLNLVRKLMPGILESMSREDLINLASQIVPELMKRCWDCMPREDLIETAHTVVVQMMENSLSPLPMEDRREMLAFYREALLKIEQKYLIHYETYEMPKLDPASNSEPRSH